MAQQQQSGAESDASEQPSDESRSVPKPESTAEYEGDRDREPTGNPGNEQKTETSSSSGQ